MQGLNNKPWKKQDFEDRTDISNAAETLFRIFLGLGKVVCNADNCLQSFRAESVPGRLHESQEFCKSFLSGPIL